MYATIIILLLIGIIMSINNLINKNCSQVQWANVHVNNFDVCGTFNGKNLDNLAYSIENIGNGEIIIIGNGDYQMKTLVGAGGISINNLGNEIEISGAGAGIVNSVENDILGTGEGLVETGTGGGPDVILKTIDTDPLSGLVIHSDSHKIILDVNFDGQVAQFLHVGKGGNDLNEGGPLSAMATIQGAINRIKGYGDASPTKLYGIYISNGEYTENLTMIPYIALCGNGAALNTKINGNIDFGTDALYNGIVGGQNILNYLNVHGNISHNYLINQPNQYSNIYFNVIIDEGFTLSYESVNTNQLAFKCCVENAVLDYNGGGQLIALDTQFLSNNNVNIKSINSGVFTYFINSVISGAAVIDNSSANSINGIFTSSKFLNTLEIIDCAPNFDSISLPNSLGQLTLTGSGNYGLISECFSDGYNPGNPANWSVVPNNVHSALDSIASLISTPSWNSQQNGIVVVSNNFGNDTTGNGSWEKPYKTVTNAINVINSYGDATDNHRYSVFIAAWNYPDPITMPSGVSLYGYGGNANLGQVNIVNAISINDFKNISLQPVYTGANQVFSSYTNCVINNLVSAFPEIDTLTCVDCTLVNPSINVGNINLTNCVCTGTLTYSIATNGLNASFQANGCSFENVSLLAPNPTFITPNYILNSKIQGTLTLDTMTNFLISTDALPLTQPILNSGAAYTIQNECYSSRYNPGNPGNWSVVPNNVHSALDTIASGGISSSKDSFLRALSGPFGANVLAGAPATLTFNITPVAVIEYLNNTGGSFTATSNIIETINISGNYRIDLDLDIVQASFVSVTPLSLIFSLVSSVNGILFNHYVNYGTVTNAISGVHVGYNLALSAGEQLSWVFSSNVNPTTVTITSSGVISGGWSMIKL